MKKFVIIAALAGLLTGCGERAQEGTGKPVPKATTIASSGSYNNYITKFCDHGRAIYSIDDDNSSALAVVLDAPECRGR